jgi:hypothetical protein
MIALAIVLSFVAGIAAGAILLSHHGSGAAAPASAVVKHRHGGMLRQARPAEIRGVHVTMELASLPGRLDRYFALRSRGLNTIELDVKDERGEVAFHSKTAPLANAIGAARSYYNPRMVATRAHARGIYLIGRVVVFEDPILAEARPALAIHNPDGSVWHTSTGLGWTNPYDRRVWRYDVGIAEAAARAGFDEIEFDYVRFASDGDLSQIVYPHSGNRRMGPTITRFARYATERLHPLGVRVSADVFGLSASHDLGIGQFPHQIGRYLDAVSPMVYPSHYTPGELGVPDPTGQPGPIVYRSLRLFNRRMRGERAQVVPWLQSFSLGRPYGFEDVQAQIDAARLAHVRGFLLWNPDGVYMGRTLRPYSF